MKICKILLLFVLLAVVAFGVVRRLTATTYTVHTPIVDVTITSHTTGQHVFAGQEFTVTCSTSSDADYACPGGTVPDTVAYTWSGPGTFTPQTGKSVTWTAPLTEGDATITVTVDDSPLANDASKNNSVTLDVENSRYLVDELAPGPTHDGSTWATAFLTLQDALTVDGLSSGDEIWVANGTYKPTSGTSQFATHQLVDGVKVYGGFSGYGQAEEEYLYQRDWISYETILSGDIDGDDFLDSENSHAVVTGAGTASTRLDGFTIKMGYADFNLADGAGMKNMADSPTVANCIFRDNWAYGDDGDGAGMSNDYYSSPTVINCIFIDNSAGDDGGALVNKHGSSGTFTNCVFVGNSTQGLNGNSHGGAIFNTNGEDPEIASCPKFYNCVIANNTTKHDGGGACNSGEGTDVEYINCTFYGNEADDDGGGMASKSYSDTTVTNCILWGDLADADDNGNGVNDEIYSTDTSSTTVTYSDVDEDGYDSGTNISQDPSFLSTGDLDGPDSRYMTDDDGLSIDWDSPCLDEGTNTGVTETDITGSTRIINGIVDMGAYEIAGLIGHWKFDETAGTTADDSSHNDNDGTLNNFPGDNSQWIAGVATGALEFDGSNDYVSIASPDDYATNSDFALSAWIRTTTGGVVVAKTPASGATGVKALYVEDSDGKLKFAVGGVDTTSSVHRVDDGMWHHVAVTVEFETSGSLDTVTLYIDGDSDATDDDWNVTYGESSFNLNIGYANSSFTAEDYFDGKMDDVRFYSGILLETQVQALYDAPDYFRFVITCDSRGSDAYGINATIFAEMVNATIAEKAEVFMFPGDLVTNGSQSNFQGWKNAAASLYNAGITVMPIRGNHEIQGGGTTTDWRNVFGADIPDNGPAGETDLTYYITHENAVFIGLDVYVGDTAIHYVNQTWLNGVLSTKQHVFVATHEPAFKVRHTDCLDDQATKRNTFWTSLENEAGCRMYFCGHDHFYDHARLDDGDANPDDDVHQFVVGTAGAPLRDSASYDGTNGSWTPVRIKWRGGATSSNYGYVVVEVWGDNVTAHWKLRNAANVYLPDNDVFEYSVP